MWKGFYILFSVSVVLTACSSGTQDFSTYEEAVEGYMDEHNVEEEQVTLFTLETGSHYLLTEVRDRVFFVGEILETGSGFTHEKQSADFSLRTSDENQHVVMEITDNQYVSVVHHDKEHYHSTNFMPLEINETFSAGFFADQELEESIVESAGAVERDE